MSERFIEENSLSQIIDDVYALLLEQKLVQETLYGLALRKRDSVVKNDTDALTLIVNEEYLALSQVNQIEKQRVKAISGIAETVGKPAKDITITDLLEHANERQKPLLASLQRELLEVLTKLKAQNDENGMLVDAQLEYIGVMLSVIAGPEDPLNNFYGENGQALDVEISRGRSILDTEV